MKAPTIDRNVPPPANVAPPCVDRAVRINWRDFAIGDSAFFPGARNEDVASRYCNAGRRLGRRFVARSVVEGGVSGVRVWRIAADERSTFPAGMIVTK